MPGSISACGRRQRRSRGIEWIYYNAQNNFTLQYPVLLAPLRVEDTEEEILRKLRITSTYLHILIVRRIWNWRAIDYSTMQYAMFLVMREIRGKSASEVAELLSKRLAAETETFASNDRFVLHWGKRTSDPPAPRADDKLRGNFLRDALTLR